MQGRDKWPRTRHYKHRAGQRATAPGLADHGRPPPGVWYCAPLFRGPPPRQGRIKGRNGPSCPGAGLMHFWCSLYQPTRKSTGVNRARSGWRGPGSRTGDPWCPGYRTGRPEKAGEGTRARTGRTKSPGITLARQSKSWGNTLLIVMVSGVFVCPLTPKYHGHKGYFFPLSNYSFEGSFRVVLRKSYVVLRPKLTPKT